MRRKLAGKQTTDETRKRTQSDDPESLDLLHVAVRKAYKAGEVHEHDYYKAIVSIAARWCVLGRYDDATSLLCELTPEYVAHGMPFQMEQDRVFRAVALALAKYLDPRVADLSSDDVDMAVMLLKKPVARA